MATDDNEYSYKAQKLYDQIIVNIKPLPEQQMQLRDYIGWVLEVDSLELDAQTSSVVARIEALHERINAYDNNFYQNNDCFPNVTRWKRCRAGDSIVESEER